MRDLVVDFRARDRRGLPEPEHRPLVAVEGQFGLEVEPAVVDRRVDRVEHQPALARAEDDRRGPDVHAVEIGRDQVDADLAVERPEHLAGRAGPQRP